MVPKITIPGETETLQDSAIKSPKLLPGIDTALDLPRIAPRDVIPLLGFHTT